ncbi:MAG: SDR family oxidoreductase [Oscillospiraceae bacterium]|nr:SDR family oxidoreductase [Oscillospiraceae bacterium]MDE7172304.1 SDR family oxidoreductase [Oscillospiraceae bacterium]
MNYYTIQLQSTFASRGIRVNAVMPGSTDTGLTGEFTQMSGGEEALLSHTGYAKRLAESKEMAEPIVFLNSNMASYISGELLIVDYGCVAEETAGIVKQEMVVDFSAILEQIKQRGSSN